MVVERGDGRIKEWKERRRGERKDGVPVAGNGHWLLGWIDGGHVLAQGRKEGEN